MKRLLSIIVLISVLLSSALMAEEQLSINLDKQKPLVLSLQDIKSFILIDESLVSASISSDRGSLTVMPRHIGSTVLHVWTKAGRLSYMLVVTRPEYLNLSQRKLQIDPGFKFGISAGRKNGKSESEITANRYEYTSDYLVIDGYGNTQYGFLQGKIGYKVRKEDTGATGGISDLKLSLEKEKTRIQFGDQNINYSEFVMPYQDIQGISFTSPSLLPGINTSLLMGVNRNGWWGEDIYRDYRLKQSFWGANIFYPVDRKLSVGFNTIYKKEQNSADLLVTGLYGKYIYNKNWSSSSELGLSGGKKALKATLVYEDKGFNASAAYRLTSSGYRTASDYSNYGGLRGLFLSTFYRYSDGISFSGKLDQYKNVDYSGTYDNQDLNTTTYLTYGNAGLTHSLWRQNRGSYYGAGVGEGQNVETYYLIDVIKSRLYYRYTPSSYSNKYTPANDYSNNAQTVGLQFNGVYNTNFVIEKQWNDRTSNTESLYAYPQIYRAYLALPQIRLYQNKLNGSFYARYQESYSVSNNVRQNESFVRGRLDWKEADDQKFYAELAITNIAGDRELALDRKLTELSVGTTYFFDTGVNLVPGTGVVKGTVFVDNNGNGILDASESGIEGLKVILGNGATVLTDVNGGYKFVNVKGAKVTVSVDQDSLASGYIFTTVPNRLAYLDSDPTAVVDFGLSSKSVITGVVFVDKNGNGLYDPGETVVPDVRLEVKDVSSVRTDFDGVFTLTGVPSGKQVFAVDIHTIPMEYSPAGAVSREIDVMPGEKQQIYVPLLSGK